MYLLCNWNIGGKNVIQIINEYDKIIGTAQSVTLSQEVSEEDAIWGIHHPRPKDITLTLDYFEPVKKIDENVLNMEKALLRKWSMRVDEINKQLHRSIVNPISTNGIHINLSQMEIAKLSFEVSILAQCAKDLTLEMDIYKRS